MNEEKNINYSAADIERYYKKQMSAKEMHALEKAALDDPFLADALEGYVAVPVNVENDINYLREKLNKRVTAESKVVPLKSASFPWLRIAALFIVIVGAGLLAYQFVFTNKNKAVAKSETAADKNITPAITDTNAVAKEIQTLKTDTQENKITIAKDEEALSIKTDNAVAKIGGKKKYRQDSLSNSEAVAAAPVEQEAKKEKVAISEPAVAQSKSEVSGRKDADGVNDLAEETKAKSRAFKSDDKNTKGITQNNQANFFRGQVLDANNTPLPFANVTSTRENVGTYTDVKGYFTLISPDSSLNVQVRSVGYENINTQLQNNVSSNAIVLQQDTKNIPSSVVSNKKINTERAKQSTMVVEEPEPYDGWYNYDTYIANNINIPDDIRQKSNSSATEVELSFEVNKYGEPINIKVEKSACDECNDEAIRLLKEGPKWKKKKKNKRARLNVAF